MTHAAGLSLTILCCALGAGPKCSHYEKGEGKYVRAWRLPGSWQSPHSVCLHPKSQGMDYVRAAFIYQSPLRKAGKNMQGPQLPLEDIGKQSVILHKGEIRESIMFFPVFDTQTPLYGRWIARGRTPACQ